MLERLSKTVGRGQRSMILLCCFAEQPPASLLITMVPVLCGSHHATHPFDVLWCWNVWCIGSKIHVKTPNTAKGKLHAAGVCLCIHHLTKPMHTPQAERAKGWAEKPSCMSDNGDFYNSETSLLLGLGNSRRKKRKMKRENKSNITKV